MLTLALILSAGLKHGAFSEVDPVRPSVSYGVDILMHSYIPFCPPRPEASGRGRGRTTEKATFKWKLVKPGTAVAMITVGKSAVLPFEFQVADRGIKKVRLSIDDKFVKMGIKLWAVNSAPKVEGVL